MSPVCEG